MVVVVALVVVLLLSLSLLLVVVALDGVIAMSTLSSLMLDKDVDDENKGKPPRIRFLPIILVFMDKVLVKRSSSYPAIVLLCDGGGGVCKHRHRGPPATFALATITKPAA